MGFFSQHFSGKPSGVRGWWREILILRIWLCPMSDVRWSLTLTPATPASCSAAWYWTQRLIKFRSITIGRWGVSSNRLEDRREIHTVNNVEPTNKHGTKNLQTFVTDWEWTKLARDEMHAHICHRLTRAMRKSDKWKHKMSHIWFQHDGYFHQRNLAKYFHKESRDHRVKSSNRASAHSNDYSEQVFKMQNRFFPTLLGQGGRLGPGGVTKP